jgi:hypothetical protein
MKEKKKFAMGSKIFFAGMPGFRPKDKDYLYIMEGFNLPKTNVLHLHMDENDRFFYRDMDKQGFIDDVETTGVMMKACKFLIPEFNEYIGFTIEDLKSVRRFFENIDEKHKYALLICDAYIENNAFTLTKEQKEAAYEEYKKHRI